MTDKELDAKMKSMLEDNTTVKELWQPIVELVNKMAVEIYEKIKAKKEVKQ